MKSQLYALFALAGAAAAAAAAQGFVTTDGTSFNIDGSTEYVAGTNAYWAPFLTNDDDVATALDAVVDAGLQVLRVWGFNDVTTEPAAGTVWFQRLAADGASTINTGADGLARLDAVVTAAEERGLKLIIPFVNYWSDYGGMDAYITAFGGDLTTWYANAAAQTQYRAYLRRGGGGAPRCRGCGTGVLTDWAAAAAAYVKGLDAHHLVTLGGEGFGLDGDGSSYPYQFAEGADFAALLAVPDLDFATLHLYPSSWGTEYPWGDDWIATHGAVCVAAGKPCLLEERGLRADGAGATSQTAPWRRSAEYEGAWQRTALATAGVAGDLFWQLGVTLGSGPSPDDQFTVYAGSEEWACLVTDHVAAI
ncbi:glycoside hydrolase superfamily [Xylariomycetidae sp. FL0641]|nr:glycoside hydrolase superfamily [Xylariomycetidae sp. FL0641]